MKTMLLADYYSTKGLLVQQIILSIGVALFVSLIVGNVFMLVPMIGVMIPLSYLLTLVAYDERNGWERYRLTMPLTRTQTVVGRYVYMIVLALASVALGFLLHGLLYLAAPLLSGLPLHQEFMEGLLSGDIVATLFTGASALFIVLIMCSIVFPLSFRFGMTKTLRWIPLAFVVVVLGAGAYIEYVNPQLLINVLEWLAAPSGIGTMFAVGALVCCLITVVSAVLASKLYQQREF